MKIVVEQSMSVGLYGFYGQISKYREAPLHQIFLQAVIDQPGVSLSGLVKLFGLPLPVCHHIIKPLELSGLLNAVSSFDDPQLFATVEQLPARSLPIDLLEGDWLALIAEKPFFGHQLLGFMPATRFSFLPRELQPEPAMTKFIGQDFMSAGNYHYQQDSTQAKGSFQHGRLVAANFEAVAQVATYQGTIRQDAAGSTLSLRLEEASLNLDLQVHLDQVRPDLKILGLTAIHRHNQRHGENTATEPILRKLFATMTPTEKQTGRGAIYEEVGDVTVKIDDLKVRPVNQHSFDAWVNYAFGQRLRSYAEAPQLADHLHASIALIDAPGFTPPELPQIVARLKGKAKMYASALADWTDASA